MGLAKYDEEIRERVDQRMREAGRYSYGYNTHFNTFPSYPSSKNYASYVSVVGKSIENSTRLTRDISPKNSTLVYRSNSFGSTPGRTETNPLYSRNSVKNYESTKQKLGYVKRNYEQSGIEIYFYKKPEEKLLAKLKNNYWRWHHTKKCWYRRYSESNEMFAKQIVNF